MDDVFPKRVQGALIEVCGSRWGPLYRLHKG